MNKTNNVVFKIRINAYSLAHIEAENFSERSSAIDAVLLFAAGVTTKFFSGLFAV